MPSYLRTNYRLTGGQLEDTAWSNVIQWNISHTMSFAQGSYYTDVATLLSATCSLKVLDWRAPLGQFGSGSFAGLQLYVYPSYTGGSNVIVYQARHLLFSGSNTGSAGSVAMIESAILTASVQFSITAITVMFDALVVSTVIDD